MNPVSCLISVNSSCSVFIAPTTCTNFFFLSVEVLHNRWFNRKEGEGLRESSFIVSLVCRVVNTPLPPNRLKVTACHLVLDSGCAENVQLNAFWHTIDVEKQLDVTSLWRIYCKSEDFFLLIQRTAIPLANRSVY